MGKLGLVLVSPCSCSRARDGANVAFSDPVVFSPDVVQWVSRPSKRNRIDLPKASQRDSHPWH